MSKLPDQTAGCIHPRKDERITDTLVFSFVFYFEAAGEAVGLTVAEAAGLSLTIGDVTVGLSETTGTLALGDGVTFDLQPPRMAKTNMANMSIAVVFFIFIPPK